MADLVFWAGPVAKYQVPGATVPGAVEHFHGCTGDGQPWCPDVGAQLAPDPSRLLGRVGLTEVDDVYLGAFSAGGSTHKRMLDNPDYRDMVTGVFLADATYTSSWENRAARIPPVITGFYEYAVDVVNSGGDKIFVVTASLNPNGQWATGIENVERIREEVEKITGKKFKKINHFFGVTNPSGVAPGTVWKLGNVIFAEFTRDSHFGHGQTVIQPDIWQNILYPWLAQGKGVIADDSEQVKIEFGYGYGKYIALGLGAVVGFFLARRVIR